MSQAYRLLRIWGALALLLSGLAACAADPAAREDERVHVAAPESAPEGIPSAGEMAELHAAQQELSLRPVCTECARICKPLKGYFKNLCTRACQKACISPCEACKNQCKLLPGSQRQACMNACSTSTACGGSQRCGNGRVEGSEQCDDGNTSNGDGCSKSCQIEPPPVVCGDGRREGAEQCDDGNTVADDGCSPTCTIEPPRCGNGRLEGSEQCDDGNTVGGDGCSPSCTLEPIPGCGNSIVEPALNETCDDGNRNNNDGCSDSCKIERCGDGVVQTGEQCDDGNTIPTDACRLDCTVPGPTCEQCASDNCRDFLGVNLVAGCFEQINSEYGAPAGDPTFIQDCINVVSCSRKNQCAVAFERGENAMNCYCGSNSIDVCASLGPAADAPCVTEFQAASRTTENATIQGRFTDLTYPVGWAYFLLDCQGNACNTPAVGDCLAPAATHSSKPSMIVPVAPGVQAQAILTVGDSTNKKPDGTDYRMVGIPDGLGAINNSDGTFTLLANHELGNGAGIQRAHGAVGAFVSKWTIRKSDLGVLKGEDLIENVQVWNPGTNGYNPALTLAFGRFCSADLPALSAFYDANSGLGYNGQLFMNGEETGTEGRAWAHALDGNTWELPRLGKASWENSVAGIKPGPKTVVAVIDDTTPGEVYIYVGNKTNTGSAVDKAGLTNGSLYGVVVPGTPLEPAAGIPTGAFTLANLGNVENKTGTTIQAESLAAGITQFNRPEDGAWDPANPNDFYFVTTNNPTSPSRLFRLRFQDAQQPELGGTIEMLLDGTEGQVMLDNIGIDGRGHILLQEDVGNNARLSQIWRYDIATDRFTNVAQHDPNLFIMGAPGYLNTQDEEASGAIDATDILGAGWWLIDVQVHRPIAGELVEDGQFIALFDPGSI